MHTSFFLPFFLHQEKILQRAITPRELAPSPFFLLCRYILLISMCLQKSMNIHHCVFKILGKKQRRGWMDRRTDNVKTVYPTQIKFAGVINILSRMGAVGRKIRAGRAQNGGSGKRRKIYCPGKKDWLGKFSIIFSPRNSFHTNNLLSMRQF